MELNQLDLDYSKKKPDSVFQLGNTQCELKNRKQTFEFIFEKDSKALNLKIQKISHNMIPATIETIETYLYLFWITRPTSQLGALSKRDSRYIKRNFDSFLSNQTLSMRHFRCIFLSDNDMIFTLWVNSCHECAKSSKIVHF